MQCQTILEGRKEVFLEQIFELMNDDKFRLLLVVGAPGIGKRKLSWELCKKWETFAFMKQYSLVLLLRLRDIDVQNIKDIVGLFDNEQDVAKDVKKVLGKGVLFILDGFDELPFKVQKEGFLIKKLIFGYAIPKSTVLVTSRSAATATLLTSCRPHKCVEVLSFTQVEVEEYADCVFLDSKMLNEFCTYISLTKNPAINSLMYVPLNAAIVVALYQDRSADCGPMPRTMTELYIELCLTLLKRCLDLPGRPEITLKDFKSLPEDRYRKGLDLCKIAYGGICEEKVIFHNLDPSLERFGFLDQVPSLRGGGAIPYNFLHLTLQEFLAAYHISQLSIDKQNIAEHQKGELWNIVRRFVAALTKSVPKFDPLSITPELIVCLYEAQCSADCASLFGGECSLEGDHSFVYGYNICEPLQAYALGYCIANSKVSWKGIAFMEGIILDSLVWELDQ